MNEIQRAFLEQLAMRIPALFEAISRGNVKSEYIIGLRRIGKRQVRLKLVAEVVEPGQSPLHTHSVIRSVDVADPVNTDTAFEPSTSEVNSESGSGIRMSSDETPNKRPSRHQGGEQHASRRRSPRKR